MQNSLSWFFLSIILSISLSIKLSTTDAHIVYNLFMATNATIVRKLYGSSTASTNDLAHIDILADSYLVAVQNSGSAVAGTAGDRVISELSTASVAQATSSDTVGPFFYASYSYAVTTSGANAAINPSVSGLRMFFPRGTRIYLHTTQSGTNAFINEFILHFLLA